MAETGVEREAKAVEGLTTSALTGDREAFSALEKEVHNVFTSMIMDNLQREAKTIESMAAKALNGDRDASNSLARDGIVILTSHNQDYMDSLNKQFSIDRQNSPGSLPQINIESNLEMIVKSPDGTDRQAYFYDGTVLYSANDKLFPKELNNRWP